jgi:hypothetical protein
MTITSRDELIQYGLRRLGHPVLEINIDEIQIDDAIDDAFQMWRTYHYDSYQRAYISRQLTINEITISGRVGDFEYNEWVTSSVTGTTFQVYDTVGAILRTRSITNGNLQVAEVLTGGLSGATATVVSVVTGDIQNRYVTLPDYVHSVTKLVSWSQVTNRLSMFDLRYQWRLNDVFSLTDTNLTYYTQMQMHLSLLDQTLIAQPSLRFNKLTNKVFIDADFSYLHADDYIVLEVYAVVDAEEFTKVYNDKILKRLVVAYLKRAWGTNMSKYRDITMPGGIVLRGVEIYQEAMQEIAIVEADLRSTYEVPSAFICG